MSCNWPDILEAAVKRYYAGGGGNIQSVLKEAGKQYRSSCKTVDKVNLQKAIDAGRARKGQRVT